MGVLRALDVAHVVEKAGGALTAEQQELLVRALSPCMGETWTLRVVHRYWRALRIRVDGVGHHYVTFTLWIDEFEARNKRNFNINAVYMRIDGQNEVGTPQQCVCL